MFKRCDRDSKNIDMMEKKRMNFLNFTMNS